MLIKYFYPNKDNKIEFTKQELEKLIKDIYEEGRMEGMRVWVGNSNITTPPCRSSIYNEKLIDLTQYLSCTDTNSIGNTIIETSNHIIGECQGDK